MGHMKNYRQLLKELPSNKVVFAFGRFQPPTAIHELQVKVVKKLAEQQRADYVIYASKDLKEELLPVDKKVHYMNLMFPNTNIQTTDASTFVEAVKTLNKKYKNIVMVSSADCKEDYEKILNKKNGSEFFFETIEVVAAGDKDPDENKLRESAKKGDFIKFKSALPAALREIDSRRLMNDIRQTLGLDMVKEEIKLVKDELREQYFRGDIFKVGEIVESAGQKYEIVKRGSNHLLLKEQSGKLVSKWIQDVTLVEGVIQQSGTDDLDPPTVDTKSTYNIAKDVMRYKDFKKLNAMAKGQVKEQEEKEIEQIPDEQISDMEEFLKTITGTQQTGHTMGSRDDNHRRRKVAYHLGEEFTKDEIQMIGELSNELLGRYKKAAGEQASAADKAGDYAKGNKRFSGIIKATKKQFDNDLKEDNSHYDEAEEHLSKANDADAKGDKLAFHHHMADHHDSLSQWHESKGRSAAADKHAEKADYHSEKYTEHARGVKEEIEPIEEISQKLAGNYYGAATKKHIEKVGVKPNMYGRIEKDMGKKRKEGIDRAFARITKPVNEGIPHIGPVNTNKVNHAGDDPHEEEWETTGICMEHGQKECSECSTQGLEETKKKKIKDDFKPTAVEVKIKDDSHQLGANNAHGFDAFFNEDAESEEEVEPNEEEITKMIDSLTDDDIMDAYDDEELAVVDDETGEEIEDDEQVNESLMEVLSRIERMRARVRFAKTKAKRERQAKLALRRTSTNSTINKRARRLAISLMKKRMLRGRPASALSVGEKERIEAMIQKRKPVLNRIAMKLTSRVRQVEKARLNHSKFTKGTPAVGGI